jgi:hypothetical protein
MLALLLLTVVLVAVCFLLGQAILALCGFDRWRWWAPALGYGALLIWFGQTLRVPSHPRLMIAIAIVVPILALALRFVRTAVRESALDLVVVGIGMTLLAAIPFFAAGHTGILGANVSNDMSQHLTASYWLRDRSGMLPVAAIGGDLITTGYPLGPHSLASALARVSGLGDVRAFSAVTLAIPVVTGFAALGAVPNARRGARWGLAAVVGLGYLPAAYLAQGSFKETIEAMVVLALALALNDLRAERRIGWRAGVPIGIFTGATIYTYSYGGVAWIAGVVAVAISAEVLQRRELFSVVLRWLRPAVGAALAAAIVIAPEYHRIQDFKKSLFGAEDLRNKGNLAHSLNPFEATGFWFNGDFRFNPVPRWPTILFCALAVAILLGSFVWWWRRRSFALPAAVIAGLLIWYELTRTVNIYNAAKGLVVVAPVLMACAGAPLALAWSMRGDSPRTRRGVRVLQGLSIVMLVGAVIASGGVLRSAPVGLGSHEAELGAMRPVVKGKATLFLDNDHFAEWELRGAKPLYTTNALYAPLHLGMWKFKVGGFPIDVDDYGPGELNKVDYIVTAGGAYKSEIPPNFKLAMRTPSYELYHREGRTPTRFPIEVPGDPGAVLDCHSPQGKGYLTKYRWAGVLPKPVVLTNWQGSIAKPGQTAKLQTTLPAGRWDVSLQYVSRNPLRVRGPGLDKKIEANLGLITSYWPAGTVTSDGHPLTLSVTADKRSWFGQLLGAPRAERAPLSVNNSPLFRAAFTRHDETPRKTPIAAACGRYVDWVAPGGSHMRGRD